MLLFWLTLMAVGNKGEVALYGYIPVTGHFWADMCAGAMLVRATHTRLCSPSPLPLRSPGDLGSTGSRLAKAHQPTPRT